MQTSPEGKGNKGATPSSEPSVLLAFDTQIKGHATVAVTGDFDAALAGEFRLVVSRLSEATNVVIDLTAVSFMDSSGLGALMAILRTLIGQDAQVRLVCAEGPVRRLLHVTGVDRLASVFADSFELDG